MKLSEDYDYFENPDNGNRYFFTEDELTWQTAQEKAETVGGNLATIRNQQEQDFLRQKVGCQRVWIGFNDAEQEGDWRWASGEPITYKNFLRGEPNDRYGKEDFAEFRGDKRGQWNDIESPRYKKRGLVEVAVQDLDRQKEAILQKLIKWARENHGFGKISEIAPQTLEESPEKPEYEENNSLFGKMSDMVRQIIEESREKSEYKEQLESLRHYLQEKEPLESLRHHLQEYDRLKVDSDDIKALREEHLPKIVSNSAALLRPVFLGNHPDNGTAIDVLQAETEDGTNKYQSQIAQLKAEEVQNNAQASAALVQALWYEQQAAKHWELSRKDGPTWTERRKTWKRNWRGKKKRHWVTITHIDRHWILWDTYTKYAEQLRKQAVSQLVETDNQSQQQERFQPLAEQWAETHNASNFAEAPITASRNLAEVLEATREAIPGANENLRLLEELLPELEQEFAKAQKEADEYNARVLAQWQEHDENAAEYLDSIEDILERRGELNKQS